jgi:phage portal protein BeeE
MTQANALGQAEPSLLIEGRNFLRIDIGAFLGIPASLMDASLSTASLTYSTSEGQRNEFADFTLPYWLEPIQHRLSLDDVVPTGQRVRFDLSDLLTTTPSPTGPPTED